MDLREVVLSELPDLPRWVEARGMLLAKRGEVIQTTDGHRLVYSVPDRLIVPLGVDLPKEVEAIAMQRPDFTILIQDATLPSARHRLPDWRVSRATLYVLPPEHARQWEAPPHKAEQLSRDQMDASSAEGRLREELLDALGRSPVWGVLHQGRAVSFAYAGQSTDTWFDVSVDTLEPHRRQGFGRAAAMALILDRMMKGLQAVWGAVDENDASRRLAERLGFAPADQLWVLSPPA